MTKEYFSQFGEDRILADVFCEIHSGTCVEVGANDGVQDSNSLAFELMGWRCVLVEPNPELCRQLRLSRACEVVECAASDESGETTLYIAEGADRAHGVSTIVNDQRAVNRILSYGFSARPVAVRRKTLDQILTEASVAPGFQFLSIDVEGHELEVLRGFDALRWRPRIIIVEDNSYFCDSAVRSHLGMRGYLPFLRTGVNDWYARSEDADLVSLRNRIRYRVGAAVIKLYRKWFRKEPEPT